MNTELLRRAAALRVHSKNGARAPHKPLLLLLAVRRAQRHDDEAVRWDWWSEELGLLLVEYAPSTTRPRPEYPFRRLVEDGLWEVEQLGDLPDTAFVKGESAVRDLRAVWLAEHNPRAGLPGAFEEELRQSSATQEALVRLLLQRHFPPTLWQDVLDATGVDHDLSRIVSIPDEVLAAIPESRRFRSATFAAEVLSVDGRRCVVCGFDGQDLTVAGARPVGLEAAHVRWWNAEGDDSAENGLTLCALHHRLFDRGMFGFDPTDRGLRPSPRFVATTTWSALDSVVKAPARIEPANLKWQMANVFKAA